jgi:DNA-directed RNA polymerase specialized sigma24 family protein
MESAFTEEYESVVASIASEYHKKYPMVEQQDISQTLWVWFITHPHKYKEWSALEQKDKDKLIAKSLRNAAITFCEKEKARTVGYELLDLYYYDVSVVEAFLPSIISESYEIPTKIKDLGSQVKSNEINDGNNWLVLRSDIASAYYKLTEAKQNVLRIRYSTELSEWADIAKDLDTTAEGARKKVQRALSSLVRNLGGFRPKLDSDTPEESTNNGE